MDLAPLIAGRSLPEWYRKAACADVDPALFYPVRGQSPAPAKALCAGCEVRGQCLDLIMRLEADDTKAARAGVWAGTSPNERHTMAHAA